MRISDLIKVLQERIDNDKDYKIFVEPKEGDLDRPLDEEYLENSMWFTDVDHEERVMYLGLWENSTNDGNY